MEIEIIDTHSHIYLPDFKEDITEIIIAAQQKNISKIILPNIDLSTIHSVEALQAAYPQLCRVAVGLHPCSATPSYSTELVELKKHLGGKNVVAIGETGIDLYWDKTFLKEQIDSFQTQARWGMEFNLPIIIHVRDSFNEVFDALDEVYKPGLTGVFHCFTGNEQQAEKALSYNGFYLGIGGVVTYKNTTLREVLKTIPANRIMLETDAPYLAPVPYRGKRNEPAFIVEVLKTVAAVYSVPVEEMASITTENSKKLFNL
ncbi:MAG: TatD family hydrolase [Flavobacteriales bacterium]